MDRSKPTLNLPALSFPLLLLILAIPAFGLLIFQLGFYWDDWPAAWFYHTFGNGIFKEVFALDRPLLGWVYSITTSLLEDSALRWQLFGILTRWSSAVLFWITVWSIWPKQLWMAGVASLFFFLYPGFSQQPIAITYSHIWGLMAVFFGSLTAMVWAARIPKWYWPLSILAWLLAAFNLFTVEYFFGLELLRPVILWLVYAEKYPQSRSRYRPVVLQWLPFVLISAVFLYWRIFLTETPRGEVVLFDQLGSSPIAAVSNLLKIVFETITAATLNSWGAITQLQNWFAQVGQGTPLIIIFLFAAGACFGLLWLVHSKTSAQTETESRPWGVQAVLLGLYALLVGGIPFLVTDLPIRLEFPWDRFTLALLFGSSIFSAGVLELWVRQRKAQILLLAVVIGLSTSFHYLNTIRYTNYWNIQRNFFWQLVWRAPQIEPGTVLLTDGWPFSLSTDNSLTAPLNWTYSPENQTHTLDYLLVNISARLGNSLPELVPDQPIFENYRAATFKGTTSKALLFYFDPSTCLHIIDPERDRFVYRYPNTLHSSLSLSRVELINLDPAQPAVPPLGLGIEPRRDWCYYYQKSELAIQSNQYEEAVKLGDEAFEQGFFPKDAHEYFPLVLANAHHQNWNKAVNLSRNALGKSNLVEPGLCATWEQILSNTDNSADKQRAVEEISTFLACNWE